MQKEPIDPFEQWSGRANSLFEKRIYRPLHYTFAQTHLPSIFFSDQDIEGLFSSEADESLLMSKLWQLSASECMRMRIWHPAYVDSSTTSYIEYVQSMVTRSSRQLHTVANYQVCMLVMPPTISALESIFIALCRPKDLDSTSGNRQLGRRYITLESTYTENDTMLCERISDGSHRNLGPNKSILPDEFVCLLRTTISRAEA